MNAPGLILGRPDRRRDATASTIPEILVAQARLAVAVYPALMALAFAAALAAAYFDPRLLDPLPPARQSSSDDPISGQGARPLLNLAPGLHIQRVDPPIDPHGVSDSPALVSSMEKVLMRMPDNGVVLVRAGATANQAEREQATVSRGEFDCRNYRRPSGQMLGRLCTARPSGR